MHESLALARRLLVDAMTAHLTVCLHYFDSALVCAVRGLVVRVDTGGVRVDTRSGERSAQFVDLGRLFRIDDADGKTLLVVQGFNANGEAVSS